MIQKLKEANVPTELVDRPGLGHGWPTLHKDLDLLPDWFDKHLAAAK